MSDIIRKVVGVFQFKDDASKEVKKVDRSMDEAKKSAVNLQNALKLVGSSTVVAGIKAIGAAFIGAAAELETQQIRLKNLAGDGYGQLKESIDAAIESSQGLANEGMLSEAANRALKFGASIDLIKNSMGDMQKLAAITGDDLSQMFQGMSKDVATGSTEFLQQNALLSKHINAFMAIGPGYDEATKKRRELFLLDAMQKESLALQEQYNETMETTNALMGVSASQWGNIKERAGEFLAKGLKPLLKIANSFLKFLGESEAGFIALRIALLLVIPLIGVSLAGALIMAAKSAWLLVAPFAILILKITLVVLAILAVILIIQDLYTFLTGGESYFGDFFNWISLEKFLGFLEKIASIIKWIAAWPALIGGKIGKMALESFGVIEARADGGPVYRGQPYVVGEEGPELFVPETGGSIVPNSATSYQSSSASYKINSLINNLTIQVTGPQEAATQVKESILGALNDLSKNIFRAELGMA